MKAWKKSVTVVVALALAAALGPAGAGATPRPNIPRVENAQFSVAGTNGFHFQFDLSKRETGIIADHRSEVVFYITKEGRAEGDRFETVLPGVGVVDVRFHQHGETERSRSICHGVPKLVRNGVFVGKIRIHGERGYTEVDTENASGQLTESPARRCGSRHQRHTRQSLLDRAMPGESTEAESIAVTAETGNLTFSTSQATGTKSLGLSSTTVTHSRRHDGLTVLSAIFDVSRKAAFAPTETSVLPSSAIVEPASPFSGSAKFELLGPHSSTWAGDLSAELPGVGPVRLAGKRFKSNLCVGEACEGTLPASGFGVTSVSGSQG